MLDGVSAIPSWQDFAIATHTTFLDRFFRAFGHAGATDAGATYEQRVKKGSAKWLS